MIFEINTVRLVEAKTKWLTKGPVIVTELEDEMHVVIVLLREHVTYGLRAISEGNVNTRLPFVKIAFSITI